MAKVWPQVVAIKLTELLIKHKFRDIIQWDRCVLIIGIGSFFMVKKIFKANMNIICTGN